MGEPRGYLEVNTPQIYDSSLWETSGHWGKYRENMFITEAEDRPMAVKPMNCPGHAHLFGLQQWSYRDLPVRYSEPGQLHRNELSGALHGLMRVRRFSQDDAHVFCTEDQIQDEVAACLDFAFETYRIFGLEPHLELSTRPENRLGDDALWDHAEEALAKALEAQGLEYTVNEGDGAFYGPKIDLHVTDSLGRAWQLGTVQLDYSMPQRFGLTYTGADNAEHIPVMIHRALMGSYERFIGILLEHYAGELPVWLTPVQALVLPIADRHTDVAVGVRDELRAAGVRADVDERTESVGRKIREAELRKIPYMLVVGDREAEDGTVAVREHRHGDTGSVPVAEFAERVRRETQERLS
jgi:threonyl-tRNA synthetase